MRLTSNFLKLVTLLTLAVMTLAVILLDADQGAQDAMTHLFAIGCGALLHSLTGETP